MKQEYKNRFLQINDKSPTTITIEADFNDTIQRSFLDLKDVLKDTKCELLINRYSGYQYIRNALKQVQEAVNAYLALSVEDRPKISSRSLWAFAVIYYGKCFHRNEGWTVTLEAFAIIKDEPQSPSTTRLSSNQVRRNLSCG